MRPRRLLFVGVPGAGKGTQAKLLERDGFKHISTGDLIRRAFKKGNPLVMPYKEKIENGGFLPDEELYKLVQVEIENINDFNGYILDGAVRNVPQAKTALSKGWVDEVLFFDLTELDAEKRLLKRSEFENRVDDTPEVIKRRFEEYLLKTKPLLDYMTKQKIPVHKIDASSSIEDIHEKVLKTLGLNK